MDHLLVPQNAIRPNIEVPYLCRIPYDGKGLKKFPQRCGYELDDEDHVRSKGSDQDMLAFYQTWLYFGLITEFFKDVLEAEELPPIKTEDSVRPSATSAALIICSVKLTEMIDITWRWYTAAAILVMSSIQDSLPRSMEDCLNVVSEQCTYLDQAHVIGNGHVAGLSEVVLSLKVLLNSLWNAFRVSTPESLRPWDAGLSYVPCSGLLLQNHMIRCGWCPFRLPHIFAAFSYNTIFYLASLPRNSTRIADHTTCLDEGMCKGDSIRYGEAFTCHHTDDCIGVCSTMSPSMEKVESILEEGGIPLITCSLKNTDDLHLEVIKAAPGVKYTAITHVWADGLGNIQENQMPFCQLKRLVVSLKILSLMPRYRARLLYRKEYARNYTPFSLFILFSWISSRIRWYCRPRVTFWMDTFCVPVGPPKSHLRRAAIDRMSPTYAGAETVFMLDSELLATFGSQTPIQDSYARVVQSAWQGRCWTLQESLLARNLFIRTADACIQVKMYGIFKIPKVCGGSPAYRSFLEDVGYAVSQNSVGHLQEERVAVSMRLWQFTDFWRSLLSRSLRRPEGLMRDQQLVDVWNRLLGRSTTNPEDVHAILANLLDFSATDILKFPLTKRMKAMLCAHERLPFELICSQSSRVQSNDPLDRWVPSYPDGSPILHSGSSMGLVKVVAGQGLSIDMVDGDMVLWIERDLPRSTRFFVKDTKSGKRWWINVYTSGDMSIPGDESDYPTCFFMRKCSEPNDNIQGHGYYGLGVILSRARIEKSGIRGVFDSSFSFGLCSWVRKHPDFENLPVIAGRLLPGLQHIHIETEILQQYKQLFRRPYDAARPAKAYRYGDRWFAVVFVGIYITVFSGALSVHSQGADLTYGLILVTIGLSTILVIVLLALYSKRTTKKRYDKWRRSFHNESPSPGI